jgi:hypothetical protein
MSRLWTLLGIVILALALSACGGKEGAEEGGGAEQTAGPTAAAGPVSIDFCIRTRLRTRPLSRVSSTASMPPRTR